MLMNLIVLMQKRKHYSISSSLNNKNIWSQSKKCALKLKRNEIPYFNNFCLSSNYAPKKILNISKKLSNCVPLKKLSTNVTYEIIKYPQYLFSNQDNSFHDKLTTLYLLYFK